MKLTSKGIGWAIAGGIVCMAVTESSGIADAVSTLMIGFTLIAIYLMKQKFAPAGIGWFLAGGIMAAFCVDTTIAFITDTVRYGSPDKDDISTMIIALVIAGGCLYAFYRKNTQDLEDLAAGNLSDMVETEIEPPSDKEGEVEIELEVSGTEESTDDTE